MYEQLVQVKGIKRSAVERMRGESEETQWVWINRMLEPSTEKQEARVAAITRIIFNFLNDALSEHPYYGREKPKDKEGGKKQRKNLPYKWTR